MQPTWASGVTPRGQHRQACEPGNRQNVGPTHQDLSATATAQPTQEDRSQSGLRAVRAAGGTILDTNITAAVVRNEPRNLLVGGAGWDSR